MTNKFPGPCASCGTTVAAGTGKLAKGNRRWLVSHATCPPPSIEEKRRTMAPRRRTGSYEVRTSGGTFYRNYAGRCEDAPCCGCCTF